LPNVKRLERRKIIPTLESVVGSTNGGKTGFLLTYSHLKRRRDRPHSFVKHFGFSTRKSDYRTLFKRLRAAGFLVKRVGLDVSTKLPLYAFLDKNGTERTPEIVFFVLGVAEAEKKKQAAKAKK
jgi:hypothetical protein